MVVIGTAGTPEGEDLVKQAGAHHVFNHRAADYTQGIMVKLEPCFDLVVVLSAT